MNPAVPTNAEPMEASLSERKLLIDRLQWLAINASYRISKNALDELATILLGWDQSQGDYQFDALYEKARSLTERKP